MMANAPESFVPDLNNDYADALRDSTKPFHVPLNTATPSPVAADTPTHPAVTWAERYLKAFPDCKMIPLHSPSEGRCSCGKSHGGDKSAAKHPRTKNGLSDASDDLTTIKKWWARWPQANMGLVMGGQTVTADLDGPDASAALTKLGMELPTTATQATGRDGGFHLVYKTEKPVPPTTHLVENVDIRGAGSYIVVEPSIHITGRPYKWINDPTEAVPAPAWLENHADRKVSPAPGTQAATESAERKVHHPLRHDHLRDAALNLYRAYGITGEALLSATTAIYDSQCCADGHCDQLAREDIVRAIGDVAKFEPLPAKGQRELITVLGSDIQERPVQWMWRHNIALGALTLFDGDPDLGKTTVAVDLAARVTTAQPMPDGTPGLPEKRFVIIATAEDDLEVTMKPRLVAAKADLTKVLFVKATRNEQGEITPPSIPADLAAFERLIEEYDAAMLFIDPLFAFLGEEINSHNDQQVRRALTPLRDLLERQSIACIVTRHFTKEINRKAIHRGGGSVGITGASRTAHYFTLDPEDEDKDPKHWRKIMAQSKNNLAQKPAAMAYYTIGHEYTTVIDVAITTIHTSKIQWDGQVETTADELQAAQVANTGPAAHARDFAKTIIKHTLKDGPIPSDDLAAAIKAAGVAEATYRRARIELGVMAQKERGTIEGRWLSALPEHFQLGRDADANVASRMANTIKASHPKDTN